MKKRTERSDKLAVYNAAGEKIKEIASLLGSALTHSITVAQVIKMYQANRRKGLASTKTRGEVSGGGRKPWKQKGTGRARVGSSRNPLWRHGGVVFGPHPRDFRYSLPQKIRTIALGEALNEKFSSGDILILDTLKITAPKTIALRGILNKLKILESAEVALIAIDSDKAINLAARNMPKVKCIRAQDLNAYDVLKSNKILIVEPALKVLEKRLKNNKINKKIDDNQ